MDGEVVSLDRPVALFLAQLVESAVVADHPEAIRIGFAPVAYYPLDFHCLSLVAEACRALVGAVAGVGFDPSRHRSDRTVEGLPLES